MISHNKNRKSNRGDLCLVIVGPPGSGKTAQAIRFSKKYDLNHISFGAILRGRGTKIDVIREHTKNGTLVPNEIVMEILQKELSFPDVNSGFVLDGYPRTLQQAQSLDALLLSTEAAVDLVIDLQMDSAELIRRVVRRRRCLRCKKQIFINDPPRAEDELCNICGSPLYRRSEDTEAIARQRLMLHEKHESDIRSHYLTQDKILSVYSDAKQDDLFEIVDRKVRTKLRW